jgi:organic hydroperoxide reductase OsmC/OhrA
LQDLETRVQLDSSGNGEKTGGVLVAVDITGQLTDRECQILSNTAKRCEIGKMLNTNVDMRYQINFHI